MKKNILILCTFFITTLCQVGFCQNERIDSLHQKVDQFVRAEKERLKIPGLSLVILKDGKIIKEKYLGFSNLELKTPVNKHSAFSIASMSKIYTASAILLLAERGKLNLNDSIRKHLPDAPNTWQEITVEQLLTHTSGLVDDWELNDDWENTHKSIFTTAKTNEDFLKKLYQTPLKFKPGTSIRYACGTFVLGVVIEKVTGKSYAQFMHEEMFEPLGLKETWIDDSNKIIPHRVSGYLFENKKLQNGYKLSPVTIARGDVSIRTSARDIAKWLTALRSGKLHNQKSLKLMYERAKLKNNSTIPRSYGGWFVYNLRGNTTYDHSGNYRTGFSSFMMEFAEDNLTIIILSNLADINWFPIVQQIASFYNPDYRFIRDLPVSKEPKNAPTQKFEKVIRTLAEGKHDKKIMSENLPMAFYGENYKNWSKKLKSINYLSHRDVSHKNIKLFETTVKRIWYYRLNADKTRYTAIYQSTDGKVIFIEYPES